MMKDTPGFNSTGIFDSLAIDSADWFPDYDEGAIGDATMTMADPNESDLFPFPQGATPPPAPTATPAPTANPEEVARIQEMLKAKGIAPTEDGIGSAVDKGDLTEAEGVAAWRALGPR